MCYNLIYKDKNNSYHSNTYNWYQDVLTLNGTNEQMALACRAQQPRDDTETAMLVRGQFPRGIARSLWTRLFDNRRYFRIYKTEREGGALLGTPMTIGSYKTCGWCMISQNQ
ncbi:unnamed protein product [Arctia plantaginis]|uniref:Uncharacterized protein n=1 Tax=Arctia plantaginis TaxID=874455 RepID=A0A8S1BCT5_ARCPL|nr:unnamed protein product [Arctia plantaginis]